MTELDTSLSLSSDNWVQSIPNIDPSPLFNDLSEIGHGNFGAVFSATDKLTNQTVAVKKISFDGKHSREKLQDIMKELGVLRKIRCEYCIEFKNVFIHNSTVWIVMEYCVGSVYDIMEIQAAGFEESHIAYIAYYCLLGLSYIHDLGFIHRDIKAANILISEAATIKLADFGSASLKSPTNTFVGSPYWMAPEVILAMEDGVYGSKSDIWSMGITCYELGERKPPHYHMNTMSAMYHIAQSDPPSLPSDRWSDDFKAITSSMLRKDPEQRPHIKELLKFPFFDKKSDASIIIKLLAGCSEAAKRFDARAYKNLKKVVGSAIDSPVSAPTSDGGNGTDSESMTSNLAFDAIIEEDVVNSRVIQEVTNISHKLPISRKCSTIRTANSIYRELQDHQDSNYLQLKDYQNMRKANMKQLKALEMKLMAEAQDQRKMSQRLIESMKAAHEKALKSMKERHNIEWEKAIKQQSSMESKLRKSLYSNSDDRKLKLSSLRELGDERARRSFKSKGHVGPVFTSGDISEPTEPVLSTSSTFSWSCSNSYPELNDLIRSFQAYKNELQIKFIEEEYEIMLQNHNQLGKAELEDLNKSSEQHLSRVEQLFKLKHIHLLKVHTLETQNQREYMRKKLSELNKRHITETKNKPKDLKNIENRIKKVYQDSIKTQQMQYKFLLNQALANAPKEQHSIIKSQLKAEKIQRMAALGSAVESHVAQVFANETGRRSVNQEREREELNKQLEMELVSLKNFQASQILQFSKLRTKELQRLKSQFDEAIETMKERLSQQERAIRESYEEALQKMRLFKQGGAGSGCAPRLKRGSITTCPTDHNSSRQTVSTKSKYSKACQTRAEEDP